MKKSKAIISMISLLLSLLVFAGFGVLGVTAAFNYESVVGRLKDMQQQDYQNTSNFRATMSAYLTQAFELVKLQRLLEDPYEEALKRAGELGYTDVEAMLEDNGYNDVTEWRDYRVEQMNDSLMNALKSDSAKNLLVQIGTPTENTKYVNNAETADLFQGALPKGYNFRMLFDGKKVIIEKDGRPLNIYGDGFYRSDSGMWWVPGYENLPYDSDPNVRISLVARSEPAEAVYGGSALYSIANEGRRLRAAIDICFITFAAALLLLVPAIGWRKHRRMLGQRLGAWTGRMFFECKLAAGVLSLVLFVMVLDVGYTTDLIVFLLIGVPSIVVLCVLLNDLRWNPRFWENNILRRLRERTKEKERGTPLQQRLENRLSRLYKKEAAILLVGGFLSAVSGAGSLFFIPVTLLIMWYYARDYRKEFGYLAGDLSRLTSQVSAVRAGVSMPLLQLPVDADLRDAAEGLNAIQEGIETAVEERMKSERLKIELITNVSHDIKTPLTSIISYVQLLNQEEDLPDYVKDYVRVLDEKSNRLKNMVQDIFEVSKASTGNMEIHMEQLDLCKLVKQTLADMEEKIQEAPLLFKITVPQAPIYILADGQRLYRVFQNLIVNALVHSMEGTRVFITLQQHNGIAAAELKNVSKYEITNPQELTERFVRGDDSRTESGSGLGLSIVKSFAEACGGAFSIRVDADLFTARIEFPVLANPVLEEPVPLRLEPLGEIPGSGLEEEEPEAEVCEEPEAVEDTSGDACKT